MALSEFKEIELSSLECLVLSWLKRQVKTC